MTKSTIQVLHKVRFDGRGWFNGRLVVRGVEIYFAWVMCIFIYTHWCMYIVGYLHVSCCLVGTCGARWWLKSSISMLGYVEVNGTCCWSFHAVQTIEGGT